MEFQVSKKPLMPHSGFVHHKDVSLVSQKPYPGATGLTFQLKAGRPGRRCLQLLQSFRAGLSG